MKQPKKINLAYLPTPIEKIKFENKSFLIKRDDLTGSELTGNKVRKLEYLLHQAKNQRAEYIFTCGGEQSNHARATAIAATKMGFKTRLFLWGKESTKAEGNLFLNKFIGSEITYLTKEKYINVNEIMTDEREKYLKKGKNVYVIPEGGSSTLGIWGYVKFLDELETQIDISKLKGILTASGSGGTSAGMLFAAALKNIKLKIYAVNVLYPADQIKKKILQLATGCKLDYNLDCEIDKNSLIVLNGYSDEGYKNITDDKLKLIKKFAQETGIILDPAYTGKAFKAFYDNFLMKRNGMKVLFVHTGGLFGVFGKKDKYLSV